MIYFDIWYHNPITDKRWMVRMSDKNAALYIYRDLEIHRKLINIMGAEEVE